jgi:hypothetical protein
LAKLVSRTAFILKGGGWYVTDFRDQGKKPADKKAADAGGDAAVNKEASPDKTNGEASKSEKTDSKPAASDGGAKASPAGGGPPST